MEEVKFIKLIHPHHSSKCTTSMFGKSEIERSLWKVKIQYINNEFGILHQKFQKITKMFVAAIMVSS